VRMEIEPAAVPALGGDLVRVARRVELMLGWISRCGALFHARERDVAPTVDRVLDDLLDAPALRADGDLVTDGHVGAEPFAHDDLRPEADRAVGVADRAALPDVGRNHGVAGVEHLAGLGQLEAVDQRTDSSDIT
jgi:hypothetical protein